MESPDLVLSFDTSLQGLSCGLYRYSDELSYKIVSSAARSQTQNIIPSIQRLLGYIGSGFNDIDLVATTTGPGAFTGLRIGLSVAKGLRLTLNTKVVGISTPQILARQFLIHQTGLQKQTRIIVVLETKRRDFYVQKFDNKGQAVSQAECLAGHQIINVLKSEDLICGDGSKRLKRECPELADQVLSGFDLIDPDIHAMIGLENYASKDFEDLSPLYLRGADVSKPKRPARRLSAS